MTERYDELAAAHYSAYPPPLHQLILGRVLLNDGPFNQRAMSHQCMTLM
jgi:hypothetical protein